jgi:hypothetical protein
MNSRCRPLTATTLLWLGLLASAGCGNDTVYELRREITRLKENAVDKDNELVAQRVTIDELHKQLAVVRALPPDFRDKVFYPEKVEIVSLSGGDDYDGKPGDDGVTVYLRPIDRVGDALKVAGDVRIELYDLQNPSGEKLIGEYIIPADQISEHWYGKLATYHYTFRCPWQHGPPAHNEITIRATFVDYLTQRVMTAQTVCTVKLPP